MEEPHRRGRQGCAGVSKCAQDVSVLFYGVIMFQSGRSAPGACVEVEPWSTPRMATCSYVCAFFFGVLDHVA